MNHQPFETWIFAQEDLNEADRLALQQHLEACQACRSLQEKWESLHEELQAPAMLAPRAGFTRRWKAGLAEKRLREQRRQAWKVFLTFSGATTAVVLVMIAYALLTSTPAEWVQAAMRTVTETVGTYSAVRELTTAWMNLTPLGLNIVIWIALGVTFCILAFIWVYAIWRTAFAGVWNK